ncbi:Thymidylate kinase [bacterium HR35]|nr:Thymidylate kinase [bacterium HR35]
MKKGNFILFEGISGSGKSTQAKIISQILKAKYFKEPPRKGSFSFVRKIILKENLDSLNEFFLFLAQRRFIYLQIEKLLNKGINIILERSFPSTYVYQYEIGGLKKFLKFKEVFNLDLKARNFLEPDFVFVFDLSPTEALKRLKFKGHKYEKLKILKLARKYYLFYAKKFDWLIIRADQPKEIISQEVLRFL